MGKKKLNNLEDLGGFVFSTNPDQTFENDDTQKTLTPDNQYLEAHFSNKGRAGKIVTVIKGFVGTNEDLSALGKFLKKKCGVGGSVKNGEIIVQGNYRDKIIELLRKENYNVKRIGG